jgi:hypothetical protein
MAFSIIIRWAFLRLGSQYMRKNVALARNLEVPVSGDWTEASSSLDGREFPERVGIAELQVQPILRAAVTKQCSLVAGNITQSLTANIAKPSLPHIYSQRKESPQSAPSLSLLCHSNTSSTP